MRNNIEANERSSSANRAFYILFGIFIFALFMLFSLVTKIAPLAVSHTVYYCQKALSNIFITLPHSAPSLISLILIVIASIGLFLLVGQVLKTYLFIRGIVKERVPLPHIVDSIAKELGIVNRIDVVKNEMFSSFCYGFMNPRICLSLKLVKTLSKGELKAVLIHENYHLKNKDPLKILLSQIATSMFFLVPTIKDIHNYYILSKEVAADQLATQSKYLNELKSALAKVLSNPVPTLNGVTSFASDNNLERRISMLSSGKKLSIKISLARLTTSIFVFALALVALNMPVYAIEDGNDNHDYFVCPYGGECMLSCAQQGIMSEMPFSSRSSFTPINYSTNH